MKNFLEVIKNNPIVVAAIAVAVLAIAALFLFVRPQGASFVAEMEKRKTDMATIDQLMKTQVTIPGDKPEAPPRTITLTVNNATNKALTQVYDNMRSQATTVFGTAAEINRTNHKPLLDNLFPDTNDEGLRFAAKEEFVRRLKAMLGKPTVADKDAARLNAAGPVAPEVLDAELEKVTNKFLAGFFPRKLETELTPDDQKRLAELRSKAAMDVLADHARRISIYAHTDERLDDFPFDIGAWAREGTRPQMRDIWEGQMSLWIQEDIVRAIALANKPSREPGSLHTDDTVVSAPIKQLIKIRVFEDYVGITGAGGIGRMAELHKTGTGGNKPSSAMGPGLEGYFRNTETTKGIIEEIKVHNPDKRLPEAFNVSPSGRVGNAIYDVRHVQVDLVVEFRQLPALFKAIGKTNIMSVLNVQLTNVDEYEALEAGYVFGQHDCVQIQMLIETIWLREWTAPLMPQVIKDQLGIVPPKPAEPAAP